MNQIKVLIVDQQGFYRNGLRETLSAESDMTVLLCDSSQAPLEIIERERPEVVLLDIDHPLLNALQLCRKITQDFPETKVILLTPSPVEEELVEAIKSRAVGYLSKNATSEQLKNTIRRAHRGENPMSDVFATAPSAAAGIVHRFQRLSAEETTQLSSSHLTSREVQILDSIARGNTNKEIGVLMGITEQTVKNHVTSILVKLNANDRAHAVALGIHYGCISADGEQPARLGVRARTLVANATR